MVRLNPLNPDLQPDKNNGAASSPGAQAQIVDDLLLNAYPGKRSRSSLDYKPPSQESVVVPPAETAPKQQSRRTFTQEEQAAYARSLQDKSSEEILKLIQENPELAQQFASAQGGGGQASSSSSSSSAGNGGGGSGGGSGSGFKKKDRLELLKHQGFPFMQWAILLLVTLYGLYRLYRWIKHPTPPTVPASIKKVVGQARKMKGKKGAAPPSSSSGRGVDVDKVVAEIEGKGPAAHNNNDNKASAKNKGKKKQPNQPRKVSVPVQNKNKSVDEPVHQTTSDDSDSDDDNKKIVPPQPKEVTTTSTSNTTKPKNGAAEDVAGFTKPNAAAAKKKKKKVAESTSGHSSDAEVAVAESDSTPAVSALVEKFNGMSNGDMDSGIDSNNANTEKEDFKEVQTKSKKAKKKKLNKPEPSNAGKTVENTTSETVSVDEVAEAGPETETDEALALRLQAEENGAELINSKTLQQAEDDAWAEVTTKRSKRTKGLTTTPALAANTTTTAAAAAAAEPLPADAASDTVAVVTDSEQASDPAATTNITSDPAATQTATDSSAVDVISED